MTTMTDCQALIAKWMVQSRHPDGSIVKNMGVIGKGRGRPKKVAV
jgi:hypothetical protein